MRGDKPSLLLLRLSRDCRLGFPPPVPDSSAHPQPPPPRPSASSSSASSSTSPIRVRLPLPGAAVERPTVRETGTEAPTNGRENDGKFRDAIPNSMRSGSSCDFRPRIVLIPEAAFPTPVVADAVQHRHPVRRTSPPVNRRTSTISLPRIHDSLLFTCQYLNSPHCTQSIRRGHRFTVSLSALFLFCLFISTVVLGTSYPDGGKFTAAPRISRGADATVKSPVRKKSRSRLTLGFHSLRHTFHTRSSLITDVSGFI